ncbi:MAG: hypothetical protein IT371_14475 [Deltaproteobacteria bacterium]|nr:hypothetical protein [Deltaproteobacteria bacterium]
MRPSLRLPPRSVLLVPWLLLAALPARAAGILAPADAADAQEMMAWLYGDRAAEVRAAHERRFPAGEGRVLMLADGPDYLGRAFEVGRLLPNLQIHRTDLDVQPPPDARLILPNLTQGVLDNRQDFVGLDERGYDLVLMRRGLCPCEHRTLEPRGGRAPRETPASCGGILYDQASMVGFLTRVAATLRSDRPGAVAMLHGNLDPSVDGRPSWTQARARWEAAAAQLMREQPIDARIVLVPRYGCQGLILKPRREGEARPAAAR